MNTTVCKRTTNNQRYYAKKRRSGLCVNGCGNSSYGYARCEQCRVIHAMNNYPTIIANRKRYIKEGKCPRCAKKLEPGIDDGRRTCINCREHGIQNFR